jgi:hypothetical protein
MKTVERQLPHFRELEQLTKTGLVSYLLVLAAGLAISAAGIEHAYPFVLTMNLCAKLLFALCAANVLYIAIRGVDKIHWLGELHVWMDKKLFRFLLRSNEIIFVEFVFLLSPDERAAFVNRPRAERSTIVQSLLSHLADDPTILQNLLRRGMFRAWIWYWINLHGIFVFLLLTLAAAARYLLDPNLYARSFLIAVGAVAVIHLLASLLSGYYIVVVTRRIVREMIHFHRPAIISFLHSYLKGKGLLKQ